MANWYYFIDGKKLGPISSSELKVLAASGAIAHDTALENDKGKSALAGKVNGLEFPKADEPPLIPVPPLLHESEQPSEPVSPNAQVTPEMIASGTALPEPAITESEDANAIDIGNGLQGLGTVVEWVSGMFFAMMVVCIIGACLAFMGWMSSLNGPNIYTPIYFTAFIAGATNSLFLFIAHYLTHHIGVVINGFSKHIPEATQREVRKMELLEKIAAANEPSINP